MPTKRILGDLSILTRKEGVRKENPLLTYPADKYYPPSRIRTPELREEADELVSRAKKHKKKL